MGRVLISSLVDGAQVLVFSLLYSEDFRFYFNLICIYLLGVD